MGVLAAFSLVTAMLVIPIVPQAHAQVPFTAQLKAYSSSGDKASHAPPYTTVDRCIWSAKTYVSKKSISIFGVLCLLYQGLASDLFTYISFSYHIQ